MAADKPLQDIYNTVRIPLTDAVVASPSANEYGGQSNGEDNSVYWNCYPDFFSDRAANQYSSQFDTWVQKRGPLQIKNASLPDNATVPTANTTYCVDNICMSNLDDVYVAAIFDWTAGLFRIIQYRPSAGTSLQIGTIAGATDATLFLYEGVVAGVATLFVSYINAAETVSTGAYATSVAGVMVAASLTVIADVDFPANLANTTLRGSFVQMDGYAFIGTKQGGFYASDINSIASWNALSVISAIQYPDQGIGLVRYKNFILFFGEDSIEFFTNTNFNQGGAGNPCTRTDQAFVKFGACFAKSIRSVNDTVYWWAKSSTGKFGLFKMDGFTPVKVSTLKEDQMTQNQTGYPHIYFIIDKGKSHLLFGVKVYAKLLNAAGRISTYVLGGQPFTDTFPSDPFSLTKTELDYGWLCFDLDTGCFWLWSHGKNPLVFPMCAANFSGASYNSFQNPGFVLWSYGQPGSGNGAAAWSLGIYSMGDTPFGSTSEYTDKDAALADYPTTCGMQFNTWDFGNEKRKSIHKFKLIWKQPGGTNVGGVGTGITPYTWVIYNKQDGNLDNANNGTFVETKIWKRAIIQNALVFRTNLNNLGTARKWTFGIIQKSNQPFAAKAIELDISQRG